MRKMITLYVSCRKDIPDLAELIAQRAWTIDGVESAEIAQQFPNKNEPVPTPCPIPPNVWAELPHLPKFSYSEIFSEIFDSVFGKDRKK